MQRKYDVCFQRKNEQSRANVEIAPYLLPHCLWYKCILSPHIFCARKFFTNVFFHITFACTNKRLVKAAITAVAPIVNTVLNMKFALKQTWSKLRKCGLYAIFATHLLPAKIHFFVQWQYSVTIDHFTVVGLVTWLLNGSEAGVDLVLIQTSLLLLCKSSCSYAN